MENFDKENVQSVGSYESTPTKPTTIAYVFYPWISDSVECIAIKTAASGADADTKDNGRTQRSRCRIESKIIRNITK